MHKICTDIIIEAPLNVVWDQMTDFEGFEKWNSFYTNIYGKLEPGSKIKVLMHPPGMKVNELNPVVTKIDTMRELRWMGELWIKGIFDSEHAFRLEGLEDNRTRLINCEKFKGILAPLILLLIGEKIKEGFNIMNHELKRQCEMKREITQSVPLA